jgi:hypothetical protein
MAPRGSLPWPGDRIACKATAECATPCGMCRRLNRIVDDHVSVGAMIASVMIAEPIVPADRQYLLRNQPPRAPRRGQGGRR